MNNLPHKSREELEREIVSLHGRLEALEKIRTKSEEDDIRQSAELVWEAPDPIALMNEMGEILFLNPAAEYLAGYPKSEMIGRSFAVVGLLEGVYLFKALREFALVLNGEQRPPFELMINRRSKEKIMVEANAHLIRRENKPRQILVNFRNITERKKIEEELRFTQFCVDNHSDAVFWINPEAKIVYINEAACRTLGYTKQELLAKKVFDIDPNFQEKDWPAHCEQVKKSGSAAFESLHRKKDGTVFPVEITVNYLAYEGKEHHVAYVRNIAERKRTEEELRKLSRSVEQSPVSIVITDNKGNIEYVNPKFVEVSGYSFDEVVGRNPRILKSGETTAEDYKTLWETIAAGGEWKGQFHNKKKNGELYWESASISPIRDERKNITHFLAVKEDITERKKMERQLNLAYHDLSVKERRYREMYEDLQQTHNKLKSAQDQLLQTEKLAAIGQLAAGIAHEINNPISFIYSNLEALSRYVVVYSRLLAGAERLQAAIREKAWDRAESFAGELTVLEEDGKMEFIKEDIHKLLLESQNGIERIKKIVSDLKTFARADHEEEMGKDRIENIIDTSINIVWNELKYKVKLNKEYGLTPLIPCRPQRLIQVFINLLMNAAQSISGTGIITVKTGVHAQFVVVEIVDTGCGIAAQDIKKIFDPFFTTKPAGQGTGLGLSISYDIVKKHGGEIRVSSHPGAGSTFTISLPAG